MQKTSLDIHAMHIQLIIKPNMHMETKGEKPETMWNEWEIGLNRDDQTKNVDHQAVQLATLEWLHVFL